MHYNLMVILKFGTTFSAYQSEGQYVSEIRAGIGKKTGVGA